jgi:threonine synthase
MKWRGVIEEFRSHLPLGSDVEAVTLLEGDTPLVPAPRLARAVGLSGDLYL